MFEISTSHKIDRLERKLESIIASIEELQLKLSTLSTFVGAEFTADNGVVTLLEWKTCWQCGTKVEPHNVSQMRKLRDFPDREVCHKCFNSRLTMLDCV